MVRRWHVSVIAAGLATAALPAPGQVPFSGGPTAGGPSLQGPGPVPAMPGMFQRAPEGPPIPGLAKRMGTIMALRHIVGMAYTRQDIEKALPILRQMRDSEKALQAKAEQIMDEEKRVLLAAQPGNPPVTDPGARLGEIVGQYARDQGNRWRALAQAIGPENMQGLRVLVAPGPQPMGPPGMPGAGPQNPFGPANPGGFGAPQGPPGVPDSVPPPIALPGAPNQPGLGGQPGLPSQQGAEPQPGFAGPVGPFGKVPPGAPLSGASRGRRAQPARPGLGPSPVPMQPGQPGIGPMSPAAMAVGPHLTVAELIDLLEQRLAAMKG